MSLVGRVQSPTHRRRAFMAWLQDVIVPSGAAPR